MAIKIYDKDLIVAVDSEEEFKTVLRVLKGIDTQLPLPAHTPRRRESHQDSGNPFEKYWNRLNRKEHRVVLTGLYQTVEGLADVQLRSILGLSGTTNRELAGVMTGLSKHAKASGLEFNSQIINKEIKGNANQRTYHYTLANTMRQFMDTLSTPDNVSLPRKESGAESASQPLTHPNGEHAERVDSVTDQERYLPSSGSGSGHET